MIGDTISHYKILEKLGEGGMGVVYKAEDSKLKRTVALKFLPPQTMASEEERDRFTREAQAAAALNHPNIATVFEINEDDGHNFIAMEYCEGESLKKKVSGGPLKITDAIDIAIQIADGLHAAHEQGVVHRDMKSANVMVNAKGQVKVMDFGLAKLKGVSLLTKQGTTLGTVAYMSPEQARGEKVDERTDIWSLGAVLYEMLSGRTPFEGEFEQSVLYAILNADPEPITGVRSNVPMDLERCLNKMMAKDPADRYQHVQEIPVDLRAVRNQLKSSSTGNTRIGTTIQSPTKRKAPVPWFLTAAMAILAGLALWAPWGTHQGHAPTMRFIETLPQGNMLDVVSYRGVDISADGTQLAYVMGGSLYIRTLENLKSTLLEGTEGAQSPFFSPDGRWIGFFSKGKLRKIPVTGGTPIALADAVDNRGGTWSSRGFIVYVPDATTGLMKIPEAGGPPQQISFLDTLHNERTHRWPAILPDGNSVLFTVGDAESPDYYEDATIDLMDINSGKRYAILHGASTARYIPDNTLVYTRSGVLFAVAFDPGSGKTTGTPVQVVQDVNGDATTAAMHYAFSQNGTLAYYPGQLTGGKMKLVRISIDGKEPQEEVLTDVAQPYAEPKISPDGTRVALVISSGKDQDIWVYNIARRTLSRLTFGATNRSPAWSPDGKRIAFLSVRPSAGGIYAKPADGSGAEEELYQGRQRMYINSWTPDGSNMVLDIPGQKGDDLFILNLREKKISEFISRAGTDEWQSNLSPDGKWIAYESNESGTYQVYVQQFPGKKGKWQITTAGAEEPRWSPDGRTIYYTTGATIMAIPVTTSPSFSAGQPRVVFSGYKALTNDTGIRYDITKDGKYIITTQPERENSYQQIEVVLNWFDDVQRIMNGK